MIYYEFWDKTDRKWYLGKMNIIKYLLTKYQLWLLGGETDEISDVQRVSKSQIQFN